MISSDTFTRGTMLWVFGLSVILVQGYSATAQVIPGYCPDYPPVPAAGQWQSSQVFYDGEGNLVYIVDGEGNRIPDFSYSGYHYGEELLPDVPVVTTLGPTGGDQTSRIQAELDAIGTLTPDANGHRGTLLLEPGTYEIFGTLRINDSGVVLRGSGDGTNPAVDTILFGRGNSPNQRTIVVMGSNDSTPWNTGSPVNITDAFVPVSSLSFHVANTGPFSVGQQILITHPSSQAWIDAVDGGGMVSDADWTAGSKDLEWVRKITNIVGSEVFLDAPIYNHLDLSLTQSVVRPISSANLITEAGIEDLRVDIETLGGEDEAHAWNAVGVVGADNCWVQNVSARYFGYAAVRTSGAIRVTVKDCRGTDPVGIRTGSRFYHFVTDSRSQLIFFTGCHAADARHSYISNGTNTTSGIVWHRCTMNGGDFEAHRHWSQGLLCDNLRELGSTNSQAKLINRGDFGTSHGWGAAHSVIWRFNKETTCQKPPTAQNYAILNEGTLRNSVWFPGPFGVRELQSGELVPDSLYEAQLCERLTGGGGGFTFPIEVETPFDQDLVVGQDAVFEVIPVPDVTLLSYAWFEVTGSGDVAIGTDSPVLTLVNAQEDDAGRRFYCLVTTDEGPFTSRTATLRSPATLLVAHLNFNDGTADDSSGTGNHGTLLNGAAVVNDPQRGNVLELDGVDDYVDLGTHTSLDLSDDGQATIAAWVKMDATKNHNSIVTKGEWKDAYSLLIKGDAGDLLWTGNDTSIFSADSIPAGVWTHVAVAIDGNLATFYINGQISGAADQNRGGGIDDNAADHTEIGREDRSDNGVDARWYFDGRMDDVCIYASALNQSEIQQIIADNEVIDPNITVKRLTVQAGRDRRNPQDALLVHGELNVEESLYDAADSIRFSVGTESFIVYQRIIPHPGSEETIPEAVNGKIRFKGLGDPNSEMGQFQLQLNFNRNGRSGTYKIIARKVDLTGLESPLVVELAFGDFDDSAQVGESIINGPRRDLPLCLLSGIKNVIRIDRVKARPDQVKLNKGWVAALNPNLDLSAVDVTVAWDLFEETISAGGFTNKGNGKFLYTKPRGSSDDLKITRMQVDLNKCTLKLQIRNAENLTFAGSALFSVEAGTNGEDFTADVVVDLSD